MLYLSLISDMYGKSKYTIVWNNVLLESFRIWLPLFYAWSFCQRINRAETSIVFFSPFFSFSVLLHGFSVFVSFFFLEHVTLSHCVRIKSMYVHTCVFFEIQVRGLKSMPWILSMNMRLVEIRKIFFYNIQQSSLSLVIWYLSIRSVLCNS